MARIYKGPADNGCGHPLLVEGVAGDAFKPGTLLKQTAAGLATSDQAATVFNSEAIVAKEQGSHLGAKIDTPYAVGDTAVGIVVRSGEFVMAQVAAGTNITSKGMALASNGAGALTLALADGTQQVLFYSAEVKNMTAAGLVLVRKA